MKRIVIIDDHAMVREGLCARFHMAPEIVVVAEAGTAAEGLKAVKEHKPDVVILDIRLPEAHGMSLISDIRKASCSTRVVILTMHDDIRFAMQAFNDLKGPIEIVSPPHVPVPFSPALEDLYIPGAEQIATAAHRTLGTKARGKAKGGH